MALIPQDKKLKVWIRDNFHCVYCNRKFSRRVKLTVDHVVPISKGGRNIMENLATSCKICNQRKASLSLTTFIQHDNINITEKLQEVINRSEL